MHRGVNVVVKGFPDESWRRFKARAVSKGLTVKEALEEALEKWS